MASGSIMRKTIAAELDPIALAASILPFGISTNASCTNLAYIGIQLAASAMIQAFEP